MTNLQKRVLVAIIYFPLLLLLSYDSRFFSLALSVLTALCWFEFLHFEKYPGGFRESVDLWMKIFLGAAPLLFAALGYRAEIGVALIFLVIQVMVVKGLIETNSWESSFKKVRFLLIGFLYLSLPFCLMHFVQKSGQAPAAIFLFLVVGATDTAAYFGGKWAGKTPFFQAISPKKTQEGFLAGLGFGILVGIVFCLFVRKYDNSAPGIVGAILVSAAVSLASVFGDLFESAMKRHFGVKDSGNLIPGHGGVLDRFDGVIFGVVPLYTYIVWMEGFR